MSRKMLPDRVVILGDGGVGKTALTNQITLNHFVETYDPTLEDSYRKQTVIDGQTSLMEILDTAGQEEYTALRDQWIKDGDAFLLVYSITSRSSFTRILGLHRQILKVKGESAFGSYAEPSSTTSPTSPVYIIVGNKCDLISDREVSTQEGNALARELGCPFIEASAKRFINVEKAFYDLIRLLRKQRKQQLDPTTEKISLSSTPNTVKGTRSWWRKGFSKAFGKSTPLRPRE